jgi:hypothetical protein
LNHGVQEVVDKREMQLWRNAMKLLFTLSAVTLSITTCPLAIAANCGHDVHTAPKFEETKLDGKDGKNSIQSYYSPAMTIMDNPSDPRHRTWGECRGQGVVSDGVAVWQGGCTMKNADGDAFWVFWSAKPGDTGSEPHAPANAPRGTGVIKGATGKMQSLIGKTAKWTGLPNGGGSYFCDDE